MLTPLPADLGTPCALLVAYEFRYICCLVSFRRDQLTCECSKTNDDFLPTSPFSACRWNYCELVALLEHPSKRIECKISAVSWTVQTSQLKSAL